MPGLLQKEERQQIIKFREEKMKSEKEIRKIFECGGIPIVNTNCQDCPFLNFDCQATIHVLKWVLE